MNYVNVLAPHEEPIVVLMGPRLRCSVQDFDVLEYFIADLKVLQRPVTFRVSGMIAGPEEFVERIAPRWGHMVDVWGPDGVTSQGRVRRLFKTDHIERDAASLIDAHALWVWAVESELHADSRLVDYEMVTIAQELNVPVFLFLPERLNYEVLEL